MEINIPGNKFIELNKVSNIEKVNYEVKEYKLCNKKLSGTIKFDITYFTDNLELSHDISEESKFSILVNEDYEIDSIDCCNIKYETIFNSGIQMIYEVVVKYSKNDDINVIPLVEEEKLDTDIVEEIIDECNDDEQIEVEKVLEKEQIELNIDDKLEEILTSTDTNNREIVSFTDSNKELITLNNTYEKIKIVFIKDENEVEVLANRYNKSISEIYKENNYNIKNKVLIRINE